jgi:tryptophanyl-tRNA synthetase
MRSTSLDLSGNASRQRVLTGIRPSGPLHLGHYAGALDNWRKLQHAYDCYFLIADYQVSDFAGHLPRVRNAGWQVALVRSRDYDRGVG